MLNGIAQNIERFMDLVSFRQKLVAANIANADTPGYTTKDIDFQSEYQSAIDSGSPDVIEVKSLQPKSDGNNVSIERESRLLSENALRFSVASNLARTELQAIREAIHDGRSG